MASKIKWRYSQSVAQIACANPQRQHPKQRWCRSAAIFPFLEFVCPLKFCSLWVREWPGTKHCCRLSQSKKPARSETSKLWQRWLRSKRNGSMAKGKEDLPLWSRCKCKRKHLQSWCHTWHPQAHIFFRLWSFRRRPADRDSTYTIAKQPLLVVKFLGCLWFLGKRNNWK